MNKKYLQELMGTKVPYEVGTVRHGRVEVFTVVYQCDSFTVLHDKNNVPSIVANDCENVSDELMEDDREYQLIKWGTPADAPRLTSTKRVAQYAFKHAGYETWQNTNFYYDDDDHMLGNLAGVTGFRRLMNTEIEVPL